MQQLSSTAGSFCQTASESQACGTPVIAFNIGGLTDIVDHLKTGYLAKHLIPKIYPKEYPGFRK